MTMQRRTFVRTLGAAAAGAMFVPRSAWADNQLQRIGLELWSVRRAMAKDPDGTMAAVSHIGYTDVELLWSMDNFGRTTAQVAAALKQDGLRAPSAHISPYILFVGWERHLETAKQLGQEYLIVPSLPSEVSQTLDDWREWADHLNTAGAVARKAGIWLAFHNEAEHMKPIDGQVPYDVFVERLDPSVVRLQLDVGNMLIGGADPMQYLKRYRDRYWSFHLKDVVADHSHDTELGHGVFDFKTFLAAVPMLDQKPCYVEQENPVDELASVRTDFQFLHDLRF